MNGFREIPVRGDIALLAANSSPDNKLSDDLRMIFSYIRIGEPEYAGIVTARFVSVNQATKEGLVDPDGQTIRIILTAPVICPADDVSVETLYTANLHWLLQETAETPRTLVIPNSIVTCTKIEDVITGYMHAYLNEYAKDHAYELSQRTVAMNAIAKQLFDKSTRSGARRSNEDSSLTMLLGNEGDEQTMRSMYTLTHHPLAIPQPVTLL